MDENPIQQPTQPNSDTGLSKSSPKLPLIILLVVMLSVAGYFASAYYLNLYPFEQTAIPALTFTLRPSPSPTQSTLDTSTWKTYTNTQYGFEIQYPNNLEFLNINTEDGKTHAPPYNNFELLSTGDRNSSTAIFPISADVIPYDKKQDFYKAVIENTKPQCTGVTTAGTYSCTEIKEEKKFTTPNGIKGYEFYIYVDYSYDFGLLNRD